MEPNQPPRYAKHVDEVIKAEKERIFEGKPEEEKTFGLALSGGGIRSASFGLGLLQALASEKINRLKDIHYLSTVSGGGYIGSSLTWFLNRGRPNPDGGEPLPAGTNYKDFPFGRKGAGDRIDADGNEVLDFIRQHGDYLTPSRGLGLMSLIAVVVRSTFVSLLVYFSLLTLIMGLFILLGAFDEASFVLLNIEKSLSTNWLLAVSIYTSLAILVFAVFYSISTLYLSKYSWLVFAQKLGGWLLILAIGLAVLGVLPYLESELYNKIAATSSGIGGILIGLYEQFRKRIPNEKEGAWSTPRILIGAAAIIYSLLFFSYLMASSLNLKEQPEWLFIPVVIVAVVGYLVNLNIFGLHRLYRDRLMETFMANDKNVVENKWGPATDANGGYLKEMCAKGNNPRPYHLVNTNLVTTDSPKSKFKGRGGDNFILSPIYCGSDATGWETTDKYRTQRLGNNGITLATAMATSGAAVNPSAGPNGQGLTKNRLISVLLGLLNIQLGFWSDNPNPEWKNRLKLPTNFINPGLFGNVLATNLSEDSRSLLLTDGGHFENLGLYELIRRRLNVIVVSDAGCDPDFKFEDLTNLIEKVRVDFGAKIKFDEKYPLKGLIPDKEYGDMGDKIKLAERGFAVAKIYYSDEYKDEGNKEGTLIYVKTTLTNDLPKDLYGYKLNNPTYPDETTADQFFSEVQFEAYRELGYQLGEKVAWSELMA